MNPEITTVINASKIGKLIGPISPAPINPYSLPNPYRVFEFITSRIIPLKTVMEHSVTINELIFTYATSHPFINPINKPVISPANMHNQSGIPT